MKKVTMYQTENGKTFDTEEDAMKEERLCRIDEIINAEMAYGDTMCCTTRELAEKMETFFRSNN